MNIKTKFTAIITALITALTFMSQFTLSASASALSDVFDHLKDPFDNNINKTDVYKANISSAWDLYNLQSLCDEQKYSSYEITLTEDIDMSGYSDYMPIGKNISSCFRGTFNGGGHTITINTTSVEISDKIIGASICAGVFGFAVDSTIKNLNVNGKITMKGALDNTEDSVSRVFAGGIVAMGRKTTIENCSFTGTISIDTGSSDAGDSARSWSVGGVVGNGTAANCFNTGTISAGAGVGSMTIGGVVGSGTATNCFSTGTVSGDNSAYVGSVVGSGTADNCYYLGSIAEDNGTGKTAEQFASGEVAWLLQNGQSSQIWGQKIGTDVYPVLTNDAGKKVYKAAFVYNGGKSEYTAQYRNPGGKFTVPSGKPSPEDLFLYWAADSEGNTKYTGTDNVSEDITVYAVGISQYGKSNIEKLVSTTYGEFNERNNIQDLSVYTAYACGVSTAGNFNYSIVSVDKDGEAFDYSVYIFIPYLNLINMDALFVMPGTPVGTYTVTIEATEKEPVIGLMSDDYDTKPFTFTVTVTVNKAEPTFEIPQNLSADYEQSLSDIELPKGFAWADGTQKVESEDVEVFEAIYTPEDTEHYNAVSVSIAVKVNPIAEKTPEAEIDYENETITGLVPNGSYILNNTDAVATPEGTLSIQKYIGKTISLVKKASGENRKDSNALSLTLPARPAAPKAAVFEVTQPSEIIGLTGVIGGITEDMEYSTDYGVTWTNGTGEEISDIESASVYVVRYLARENQFRSNPYVIAINAIEPEQEPTPEISIDYENELLTGFDTDGVYLINGELLTDDGDGGIKENMPIKDEYIGQVISIVRIGWINSEPQLLAVPARPEMPAKDDFEVTQQSEEAAEAFETEMWLFAAQTSSISGITSDMEYSTDYGETWTDGTGETIENIAGGTTYSVRVKATDDSFKSMSNVISINSGEYTPEPTPEIGIDLENELLTGFEPNEVYLINGELLKTEDGGSITENMPLNEKYIGQTISIVRIGMVNSEPQLLEIPLRPNAPTESDFNVTQPSEIIGLTGAIDGITSDMEYSTDYGKTWIDGSDTEIENIEGGTTFSIRKKATDNSLRSMTYVISIISAEPKQEETPEISVDYENKSLAGFDPDGIYLINGELFSAEGDGSITEKMPIKDKYFGQTLSIIKMGMVNSEPQLLVVEDCPTMTPILAVNQTKIGAADGKITGVDETMEYSSDGGEWTDVQGTEITGLSDGEYTVRIKAAENSFASDAVTVTIGTNTATVIFVDYNGSVLQAEQLEKGKMPEYDGNIPSRPHDDTYSYVFSGWSGEIAEVSEDVIYEAQYTSRLRECSIEYSDGKAVVYVPENTDCAVVFAAYDADGTLMNIKIETTMLESGMSIVTPVGFDTEGAASVTVMLWDSLDSMMSLCSSNKVQLR